MAIYGPTPGLKGRTFELWVLNTWVFNFCICSTPLWNGGGGDNFSSFSIDLWSCLFKTGGGWGMGDNYSSFSVDLWSCLFKTWSFQSPVKTRPRVLPFCVWQLCVFDIRKKVGMCGISATFFICFSLVKREPTRFCPEKLQLEERKTNFLHIIW